MGSGADRGPGAEYVLPGKPWPKGSGRVVPIGRHGRPKEEIDRIQRQRIMDAFVIVVGRCGVLKAHITDVCTEAGVSTREFYQVFENKDECFLSAFDTGARVVLSGAQNAYRQATGPWEERLLATLDFTFTLLAKNQAFARLSILESQYAGPAAYEILLGVVKGFRETLGGKGAVRFPFGNVPAGALDSVIVGSAFQPIVDYVRDGKTHRLAELAPILAYSLAAPIVGHERAVKLLSGRP